MVNSILSIVGAWDYAVEHQDQASRWLFLQRNVLKREIIQIVRQRLNVACF